MEGKQERVSSIDTQRENERENERERERERERAVYSTCKINKKTNCSNAFLSKTHLFKQQHTQIDNNSDATHSHNDVLFKKNMDLCCCYRS
jgi:hypothetical protein